MKTQKEWWLVPWSIGWMCLPKKPTEGHSIRVIDADILHTFKDEVRKALPHSPKMDGIASYSHEQKIIYRAIQQLEEALATK